MVDAPVKAVKGPPVGFSKDVNAYLNSFVTLCHMKAGAVLGAALTLAGLLLRDVSTFSRLEWWMHYGSVGMLLGAAFFSASAIFPKLRARRGGVIFWEDIRDHATPEDYIASVSRLDVGLVEQEYSYTNYFLSDVLHAKYRVLQWAIFFLAAGAILAGLSRIL